MENIVEWSEWGPCSSSCGGGVKTRRSICDFDYQHASEYYESEYENEQESEYGNEYEAYDSRFPKSTDNCLIQLEDAPCNMHHCARGM